VPREHEAGHDRRAQRPLDHPEGLRRSPAELAVDHREEELPLVIESSPEGIEPA